MAENPSEPESDVNTTSPQTALDFFESGWRHYSSKEFFRAEEDFKKANEITPDYIDAIYGLGMAYQASNRLTEAVQAFEKVIELLETNPTGDSNRTRMLASFARGHINRINTGDWHMRS